MFRATFLACGIAASLAFGLPEALAQQFGGGGNSGFGGGGGGFGGGSGGGGSAFGSSGFGSSGGGGGGFGSGTSGFSGFGGSAFGGGSSSFGGGFGNSFGSNGIGSGGGGGGQGFGGGMNGGGGQGSQGGQQFIGRSNSDMQSMMKNLGKSSNQFFQQLNRTLGQNRGKGEGQKENAKLTVPVKLNVAFDNTTPVSTALAGNVHTHLDKILVARKMPVPGIVIDGDTVVLSGTADSDSQRLLIEKLVSLEPGVSQVSNQMTVAGSSPAAILPQPAGN
jgi:osmotically-inducible protein OsmY